MSEDTIKGKNIGVKMYRYINDRLEVIRILRIKNSNLFIVRDEGTKIKLKMTKEELSSYTELKPDAVLAFCILQYDIAQDVAVSMSRISDISNGNKLPYAICRQNVYDIFKNQVNRDESIQYVGMSVSIDTAPDNSKNILEMLRCSSMPQFDSVYTYIDDSLDDILSLINTVNYDTVLSKLYTDFENINYETEESEIVDGEEVKKTIRHIGMEKTLKDLLQNTSFMSEYRRGFNILEIDFEISNEGTLLEDEKEKLEDVLKYEIVKHTIIRYKKDINMTDALYTHQLIADSNNKIYVLIYDKGEYINRSYDSLEDQSEKVMLAK